ncbi:glycosyltransferase family 4 protein [Streptomonospora nanhaiensis]|uniref:Glycosyltransferase involved in cell wall biosynthesis n=1 Tax=Streptomonospora nanhaiensis TaxID=1323731 RepID=A0A853BMB5_9ACTN|nr:glycosyltransferase family 4 protein [Streptomonospora nanhaiensis]MBV2363283.1 glycosyltransferase family 4 protein [Streptomonospora nanhaiensis]MBX9389909.1 glycosyltransferase family 4 protein [Streptomonospora nanhaiensis]NYI95642.1 glycosyltransferase involved in cell wall biosynthesis [Streptomonospora nanhaiensis]
MRIRYLLLNAFGTGGTIRTVFNQANTLVERGNDIEIVSVVRHRDTPVFPLDDRVRLTTIIDERGTDTGATQAEPASGLVSRYRSWDTTRLKAKPGAVVPAGEFGAEYFTRYVEREVIRYLKGVHDGILVSTRPALNILVARYADPGLVRVAQEHMNLGTHRKDVQQAIARYYPRFDAVAVLTHRDRADYEKLLPRTRVVRIPNAVHSLDQVPSDHSNKIALAAGRLIPQKGFDMLIPAYKQVAERHPDWQLRIFGTGKKKAELRALIEEHHLYNHVFLMGHTDQMDDELAKASFYILSSRFEGLPMVVIEAMTHALPVVSFDCPTGPADVITDGKDGILVPPKDTDALAEAICTLMADRTLRADMGAAALETSRGYAPSVVHPMWEELYGELTAARGGTRQPAS